MTSYGALLAVALVVLLGQAAVSDGLQCYQQNCLNCRNTTLLGAPGECNPTNFLNIGWLQGGQVGNRPLGPLNININIPGVTVEYTCVKFVSKDKNNANALPHQLRGCMIGDPNAAEIMCAPLIAQQRDLGRTAECFKCQGNLCNSGVANGPITALLAIGVLAKLFGIL